MHPPRITNKTQNSELLQAGLLGNTLRLWSGYYELKDSGYRGTVTVRYDEIGSTRCWYLIPVEILGQKLYNACLDGAKFDRFRFNESAPDDRLTIQGELVHAHTGWFLKYSTLKMPMRPALEQQPEVATGIVALEMLKYHMDPHSYIDVMELFEVWPDHVVEFSTYGCNLGKIPQRNTVVWEVRSF